MINPYYYLYYRLYKFVKKVGTVNASWTAMLLVLALITLNVFTALFIVFNKNDLFFLSPKIIGGFLAILVGVFNYFVFIYKDKCNSIIENYESENKLQKLWSSILTVLYIVLTWYLAHLE